MSDDIVNEIVEPVVQDEVVVEVPEDLNPEPTPEQVVAYDTHAKLLNQRKNDQGKLKEMADQLEQMKSQVKQQETAKLEEKQEYKKLYEASQNELEGIRKENQLKEKALVDDHKRRALEKELGGLKNAEYFRFADLSNIVVDEDTGLVDGNSVRLEANNFRKNYGELLTSTPSVRVNSNAPQNRADILTQKVSAQEMTADQRSAYKRNIIKERIKKQNS